MSHCPTCQKSLLRQNDLHHVSLTVCDSCGTAVIDFDHRKQKISRKHPGRTKI